MKQNSSKGAVSDGVLSPATVGGCASSRVGTLTAGDSLRAVRERGILMSGPMVLATLAGIKTETRRVAVPQPIKVDAMGALWSPDIPKEMRFGFLWSPNLKPPLVNIRMFDAISQLCPYGRPGDRLYVRETFRFYGREAGIGDPTRFKIQYVADGTISPWIIGERKYWDKAIDDITAIEEERVTMRPSIFLPKWASRIWLEITKVQLQFLQSITNKQAIAEGAVFAGNALLTPRLNFEFLWAGLNANRIDRHGIRGGYAWARNPVVWRICFRRITL